MWVPVPEEMRKKGTQNQKHFGLWYPSVAILSPGHVSPRLTAKHSCHPLVGGSASFNNLIMKEDKVCCFPVFKLARGLEPDKMTMGHTGESAFHGHSSTLAAPWWYLLSWLWVMAGFRFLLPRAAQLSLEFALCPWSFQVDFLNLQNGAMMVPTEIFLRI